MERSRVLKLARKSEVMAGPMRRLARILREAADTSGIDPYEASERIAHWWPTLSLSIDETTADIARALAGVPIHTPKPPAWPSNEPLFRAICAARSPNLLKTRKIQAFTHGYGRAITQTLPDQPLVEADYTKIEARTVAAVSPELK